MTARVNAPRPQTRTLWPLALLLAARLALGLTYSLVVPLWESYDEDGHFAYVRYLAKYRTLLRAGDPEAEAVWEKFQPPLYYLVAAPAVAWLDLGETFTEPERNPYYVSGRAGVNVMLHPDPLEGVDYRLALAAFIVRGVSVLISTVSVAFVYGAAQRIWPDQTVTAWAAACLYAFWPQFLFIGGMITNDMLITSLSAAAFYFSIVLATDGFRLRYALWLGLILAAALLTKLNGVALIPVAVIALGMGLTAGPRPRGVWPTLKIWLALALLSLLVIAVLQLLGSFQFVTEQVFRAETVRQFITYAAAQGPASALVTSALRYGFRTFLASFGWGNFEIYRWVYWLWGPAAALALAGPVMATLKRLVRPRSIGKINGAFPVKLLLLMALQVLSLVGLVSALTIAYQNTFLAPGRYLLPILPSVSCLLVGGWLVWFPVRWRGWPLKTITLGFLLLSWSLPLGSIVPAYAKPQPLAPEAVIDYPFNVTFGEEIELLGYLRPQAVLPGQKFKITLCWRAVVPVARNYSVFLEIVGPDGQGYGRLETYPGRGNYPTSFWTANERFCDHYSVEARKDAPAPAAASLHVALLDGVNGPALPVSQLAGNLRNAEFAEIPIKIQATRSVLPLAHPVRYRFGGGITLKGYDVQALPDARGAKVSLLWEASQDIGEDYTVFVHLRDTPRTAYAQGDSQPRGGWYPTSLWQAGETILDEHILVFPDHQAPPPLDLYVGLIHAETLVRLLALDERGNRIANNEVILARGLAFPLPPITPP